MSKTTLENKISILSELWTDYRDEVGLEDFMAYCDLALPLSYCLANGILPESNDRVNNFIEEAYGLLMETLGTADIDESEGFQDLTEVLSSRVDE